MTSPVQVDGWETARTIVPFSILIVAVLWQTNDLRAEFVRGFQEDLEYAQFVSQLALRCAKLPGAMLFKLELCFAQVLPGLGPVQLPK